MNKQKLKIGLLIDDYKIPFWTYKMVELIQNSSHSEIVVVVKKKYEITKNISFISKLWQKRKTLLFEVYIKLERKLFSSKINVFEQKELKNIIDNIAEIEFESSDNGDLISANDISKIDKQNIDVLINLSNNTLNGEILNVPKFGVWAYYHGDSEATRGKSAGVWEVLEDRKEIGTVLQILGGDFDSNITIYKTLYTRWKIMIGRSQGNYFWQSKSILPRKLEELFEFGEDLFFEKLKKQKTEPFFYYNKLYDTPKNIEFIINIIPFYWRLLKKVVRRIFKIDQWILLYKMEDSKKMSKSFHSFKRILPPTDRFWADPFIHRRNNTYYIFFEELIYKEDRGKICVMEMDDNGNYSIPEVVLETPYHLSYPFLIEECEDLFMLPETFENKTIELYKCIEFPKKWAIEKILINNITAMDSTIFKHHNKYWLFTNVEEYNNTYTGHELFLFYSDSLLNNDWIPHPENPIINNHSYSRPAGNIFEYEGRLFRPAQNCSKHYGYGMHIREILTLNEQHYEERDIQTIYPNWDKDLMSTHTINSTGNLTFIDAIIKRWK